MPTSASRTRRSALAPFRLSILFLFSRGDFFKIVWAEMGLGRASSKEEAVVMNTVVLGISSLVLSSSD